MTCVEPRALTLSEQAAELVRIASDPLYFATHYIQIKPDDSYEYQQFEPWPHQERLLDELDIYRYHIWVKARQLGQTTLVLIFAIWLAMIEPNSLIALVSRQKSDAYKLIEKLRSMWQRLPEWLRDRYKLATDNAGTLALINGSIFLTFASNKSVADGLTLRLGIVDESDLIVDLARVLNGLMPAVAKGGQLVLLSKSNKDLPESKFKAIYKEAIRGGNTFRAHFLPWWSRPDRTQEFYASEASNSGSIDFVWENYPASIDQAFAPRQESKRIPLKWLESCIPPLDSNGLRQWPTPVPAGELPPTLAGVPGLRVYVKPESGHNFVLGVDLASGKTESPLLDDSAIIVMDEGSREQVAAFNGKLEPKLVGGLVASLSRYYLMAGCLIERNGEWGGTAITWLEENCRDVKLIHGPAKSGYNKDAGFNTTTSSKISLYEKVADGARVANYHINDRQTFEQLSSIEARTLEAPPGWHDDLAMAFGFAIWAAEEPGPSPFVIVSGPPEPPPPPPDAKPLDRSWASLGTFGVPQPPRRRGI